MYETAKKVFDSNKTTYIEYTQILIEGRSKKTGEVVRKFTKYKETLRKRSLGGNYRKEISHYFAYYIGDEGKKVKVEKSDIFLPTRQETMDKAKNFKMK